MNKRIKKKLEKRLFMKSYSKYRDKLLNIMIDRYIEENNLNCDNTFIYVLLSKRGKKVLRISAFTNVFPIAINNKEVGSIELEFNCTNQSIDNNLSDHNRSMLEGVIEEIREYCKDHTFNFN